MNRAPLSALLLSAALAASSAPVAAAAKLVVPKQFPTIQAAVDAALPGDVVVVLPGTYHENVSIDSRQDLVVRGKGKVVIDGGGNDTAVLVQASNNVHLKGLRVRNAAFGVSVLLSYQVLVEKCRARAVTGAGISFQLSTAGRVRACRVSDSESHGVRFVQSTACVLEDSRIDAVAFHGAVLSGTAHTVVGNELTDVGHYGVRVGYAMLPAEGCLVADNRIDTTGDTGILVTNSSAEASVLDNVVVGAAEDGIYLNPGCDGANVCRNVIRETGDSGIELYVEDTIVSRNRIKLAADRGIDVESGTSGSLFFENRIRKSGADGVRVRGTGNTFLANVVKKSDLLDLNDETPPGSNLYSGNVLGDA